MCVEIERVANFHNTKAEHRVMSKFSWEHIVYTVHLAVSRIFLPKMSTIQTPSSSDVWTSLLSQLLIIVVTGERKKKLAAPTYGDYPTLNGRRCKGKVFCFSSLLLCFCRATLKPVPILGSMFEHVERDIRTRYLSNRSVPPSPDQATGSFFIGVALSFPTPVGRRTIYSAVRYKPVAWSLLYSRLSCSPQKEREL